MPPPARPIDEAEPRRRYDPKDYVEAVLDLVERIPPGRVVSYGALAERLGEVFDGGSARLVGQIMARYGASVPWHRVVNAAGRLPPGHEAEATRRLAEEGVAARGGRHVSMAHYSWDLWAPTDTNPTDTNPTDTNPTDTNPTDDTIGVHAEASDGVVPAPPQRASAPTSRRVRRADDPPGLWDD